MADIEEGVSAPDDASLFSDATNTTLEKFENAEPVPQAPPEPKKPDVPVADPAKADAPKPDPEAAVPPGRFREEAEARRRAERERDDLLRQLAAARQPPPPQQPSQKAPDLFENPAGFVQNEVKPYFEQIQQRMQLQAEAFSQQMAMQAHGPEKVAAAKQALTEGMHRGDPSVRAVWEQAMQSAHPYDVITRWHLNNETMREVGGDIAAYRKKVLEEALKDPAYQRQVIEASKGTATHVARPAPSSSSVPQIPSLGNIGAGGDTELQEPSDEQLFRAATSAKRR